MPGFHQPDDEGYIYSPLPPDAEVVEKDGVTMLRFKPPEGGGEWRTLLAKSSGSAFGRGMRVDLPTEPLMAEPIKKPLFDHVTLDPDKAEVSAFVGGVKEPWQTNIRGDYGCLPAMHHYYAYGLSIIPDASAPRDDVLRLWETGTVEFRFASNIYMDWPMRDVMADPKELAKLTAEELRFPITERKANLCMKGKPVEIAALEAWRIRVSGAINREKPVSFMVVLHGIAIEGLVGHTQQAEFDKKGPVAKAADLD